MFTHLYTCFTQSPKIYTFHTMFTKIYTFHTEFTSIYGRFTCSSHVYLDVSHEVHKFIHTFRWYTPTHIHKIRIYTNAYEQTFTDTREIYRHTIAHNYSYTNSVTDAQTHAHILVKALQARLLKSRSGLNKRFRNRIYLVCCHAQMEISLISCVNTESPLSPSHPLSFLFLFSKSTPYYVLYTNNFISFFQVNAILFLVYFKLKFLFLLTSQPILSFVNLKYKHFFL